MKRFVYGLVLIAGLCAVASAQQRFNNPSTTMVQGSAAVSSILTGIPSATILTVRNTDAASTRITADSAGTGVSSGFIGRSARGTVAAPTATQTDDVLAQFAAFGYGATAYSATAQGGMLVRAGGNWTDASYPSYLSLLTTPVGATANLERWRVETTGSLVAFGATSGTGTISVPAVLGTRTWTLPTGTGTFAITATSPVTLNATTGDIGCATCGVTGTGLQQFASTTSAQLAGVISDETGSGALAFATSPTLVTPTLGVATATSVNKVAITAPATASTLTIDDGLTLQYSEGTWTPVLTFATPGDLSVAYTTQLGTYTRVGRLVTVTFNIVTSTFTHTTASGAVNITGLPFTSQNVAGQHFVGTMLVGGITKAGFTQFIPRVQNNVTQAEILANASGSASTNVTAADMPTGGTVNFRATITYQM